MRHMLNIKPFDEFWFDCTFNNLVSIISTIEESYKYAMYHNDYFYQNGIEHHIYYESEEHVISSRGVQLNSNVIKQLLPIIDIKENQYIDKENFLDEIKGLLCNNTIILPGVDLYYWNKDGHSHHNIHVNHNTLLVGFDDEKKELYALEDDIHRNYKIITESESDFIESVKSNHAGNQIADYLTYTLPETLPKYHLPLQDIVRNISNINGSLRSLKFDDLYTHKYNDEEFWRFTLFFPKKISKIIVRQQANISLLSILHKRNIISKNDYMIIVDGFKNTLKTWTAINNYIRKAGLVNVDYLNKKANTLISLSNKAVTKEIESWNNVETAIVNSKISLDIDLVPSAEIKVS